MSVLDYHLAHRFAGVQSVASNMASVKRRISIVVKRVRNLHLFVKEAYQHIKASLNGGYY